MNYENACSHLNLQLGGEYNVHVIKKQYRLMALTYHPDKNHSIDASKKFQEINNAYEYLLKYCEDDGDSDSDYEDDIIDDNYYEYADKTTYRWMLFSFLKNILESTGGTEYSTSRPMDPKNNLFYVILQRVVSSCESKALDILYKLDKSTLIRIYDILKQYEDVFHCTREFIVKIELIIADKIKCDECIILNPTIDDLFQNNLYKLTINEFTYIVPLWHDELIYDNSGNDIIVKCYPMLPENMYIDNNNDVHVNVTYKIQDIWNKGVIDLVLGYNRVIKLNTHLLKLNPSQTVIFAKQGISKINTDSVYEISKLSDILLHIQLVL